MDKNVSGELKFKSQQAISVGRIGSCLEQFISATISSDYGLVGQVELDRILKNFCSVLARCTPVANW